MCGFSGRPQPGPDQTPQARMEEASANEQYELAAHYRDAIETMETLAERQKMAVMGYDDIDIFGYHQEDKMVAVSVFHMRGGRVVDKRELFWEDQENFTPGEFFGSVLKQYYVDAPFIPVEIHVRRTSRTTTFWNSGYRIAKAGKSKSERHSAEPNVN